MRFPRLSKFFVGRTRSGGRAALAAVFLALAVSVTSAGPVAAAGVPAGSHQVSGPAAKPRTAPQLDPAAWMTLEASPTTANGVPIVGGAAPASTLSAYSSFDVGPTPYYIQIWDLTTNTRLASCGSGNTCSVKVVQTSTTTHRFAGTVALSATAYPPTGIQSISKDTFVTWQIHIAPYYNFTSVRGMSLDYPPYNSVFTVTSNLDVSTTPYYIEIFDVTKGTLVAACGSGTTCSATVSHADSADTHVAFISTYGSTLLPPDIKASSGGF